ncbi:MAG: hypothetical protein K5919_03945 [Clostridiales bacterium]|nr:hypothetical protein [Clostridiales bacterium]
MRLNTPINKEEFKTHVTYNVWKYALLIAAAVAVWSFIGEMKPSIREEKKIELYVMSNTASSEILDPFLEPLWQEYVPDMESVCAYTIPILDDYSMDQYFITRLYAKQGDIYFMNEKYFKQYASIGFFLPLEDLIQTGAIDPGDADLEKGKVTKVNYNSDNEIESTEIHLYGIPLDGYSGFLKKAGLNNTGMYAVIMVFNQNDENVIPFFNVLLQAGRGEKTENAN